MNIKNSSQMMKLPVMERQFMNLRQEAGRRKIESTDPVERFDAEKAKLRKAAEGFEAIFIRQFLKVMRSSTTEGSMFGKGSTGEIYADMMDNSLAEVMSKRGTLGISDQLYNRMVKKIELKAASAESLEELKNSESLKSVEKD